MKKNAFTLVEIMIVVAIIGILAAIAIPNLAKSRERSQAKTCVANLKTILGATETYAAFNDLTAGDAASIADMVAAGDLKDTPTCPVGTTAYADQVVGNDPVCPSGTADHVLP